MVRVVSVLFRICEETVIITVEERLVVLETISEEIKISLDLRKVGTVVSVVGHEVI
jgi:hypothetical protein